MHDFPAVDEKVPLIFASTSVCACATQLLEVK